MKIFSSPKSQFLSCGSALEKALWPNFARTLEITQWRRQDGTRFDDVETL